MNMARMITGLLLKSYMTVARLMGAIDSRKKNSAKPAISRPIHGIPRKAKLKQA
jgi:hypothetical protein